MTTTTKIGDYLGRELVNWTPGTSAATDTFGRNVGAADTDFLGRALLTTKQFPPSKWVANTAYTLGERVRVVGANEVQTISLTGTPTGGTFTLTFDGQTTGTIAYNADGPTTVQTALLALSTIGATDLTVAAGTGPWVVTFAATFSGLDVPMFTLATNSLTGGTLPSVTIVQTTRGYPAFLECTVAGTSHAATMPTAPAMGATVVDSGATWRRIG